jgi:PAS domain S-box-containing protein
MISNTLSLADYMSIVNSNPDMISKINRDLVTVYVNDSIWKYSNLPYDFFIGKTVKELAGEGAGQNFHAEKIQQVFETGVPFSYEDSGWYDNDANMFFEFNIIPLERVDNKVQHVLVIIKNVTENKKKEDQLRNTIKEMEVLSDQMIYQNKVLQDFAYITSHNLRSPIANFKALLQIYEIFQDEEEKKAVFDKIKNASESLTKTINELTDTISIKGSLKKELELLSFQKEIDGVKESIWIDVEESGAIISTDFKDAPTILYPKIYLESIILNLLTNSMKYRSLERPLKIHVSSHKLGDKIVFTWNDNGIGIDLEKHGKQLFGLKNTFHDREDSRGIGLYITRNQIESVGGTITAESKVDEGCTFKVTFKDLRVV